MESSNPLIIASRWTRWRFQRAWLNRVQGAMMPSRSAKARTVFITLQNPISASQIFPFFFYRKEIAERWGYRLGEVRLESFEDGRGQGTGPVDVVCLQVWFDIDKGRLLSLIERIRTVYQPKRLVFFDSFAPTDLRLAEVLDPHIDLYVKKHVFRDRGRYGKPTLGDTNLTEYYGDRYDIDFETVLFPVPDGFLDKLIVGPSFATSDSMMPVFLLGRPRARHKSIDVHGRLGWEGSEFYEAMRKEAISSIDKLQGLRVVSRHGVNRRQYIRELSSAKICFSPFGYGEVAWRDYEAVMCGSLLIKPDMSHLETEPDIFIPGETYVPVKWDFSDVEDQIRYYLDHPSEREAIADKAFQRLHRYFVTHEFLDQMAPIFEEHVAARE